jgi:hypothetical protein
MADDFSRCMALLEELEQSSLHATNPPALSAEERSLLLARLFGLCAAVATEAGEATASAVLELGARQLRISSSWFG